MGFLGLSLLFVGIVLVMNGVLRLCNADAKSYAFMNVVTGGILVVGNFIMLAKAEPTDTLAIQNVASGLLFGFTYLFVAANYLFKLDLRPFGWFSFFVAIWAIVMAVLCFVAGGTTSIILGALWSAWAVLWAEGFLELVCKLKIGKIFPYLSIFEGIVAAFVPAVLMLTGVIHF